MTPSICGEHGRRHRRFSATIAFPGTSHACRKGVGVAVLTSIRVGAVLSVAGMLMAACGYDHPVRDSRPGTTRAGQSATTLDTPRVSSRPTASRRRSRPSPPCPPVHELSYIVGVHLHAVGAWAHLSKGVVRQRCTYAPPGVDVAGEAGGYRDAPFSFRIPAVQGAPTVEAAYAHFALLINRSSGSQNALRGATLLRKPVFGPGAFLLRVPGHGLPRPASCEVVEANGNGQPIGVMVRAIRGQPRPVKRLCRQAVAAAHMLP